MDFELDKDQRAWRDEVRAFLRENVTPELLDAVAERGSEQPGGPVAAFRQKVAEKGWWGLNWPKEYGGIGLGPVYQHILVHEFGVWGVPGPGPDRDLRRPDDHAVRHPAEQRGVPAADREG